MKKQIVPITLLSLLTASANLHAADPDTGFAAYHTRMNPSPVGHIGKYEDLVVTLGKTNRLEFTRANGYQPQWRTAKRRSSYREPDSQHDRRSELLLQLRAADGKWP